MRGLSDAVDAIWINILMLVTSIPIVTIGAALTARSRCGTTLARRRRHRHPQLFHRIPVKLRKGNRLLADFRHCRGD